MADGAVNFLLDKLTTILVQKASLLGDSQDDVEEIKLELESIKSFLKDAERRKEMSESVETWVRQVREVAYEVEDLVDEFMHHKFERQGSKSGIKGAVLDLVTLPKSITTSHSFSSRLQSIKGKVLEISKRSERYSFKRIDEGRSVIAVSDAEPSSVSVDEDELVGMEENSEQLLGWLTDDEPRRTVISVVGMGGLGKTTLVTRVYNDPIIKRHFECWAWISVSEAYGMGELLRSLIRELSMEKQVNNLASVRYTQLVGMLIEFLHQKRYVIVLDDVWSIDLWSKIRGAFPNNKYGSRIILTTRDRNVAASVGVGSRVHQLQPLREDHAWTLFCNKAFWNQPDRSCPNELEALAQAIMKKCECLPLAIVAIGGLMSARRRSVVEWKKVYESLNWQLSNHPLLERVKTILVLSFNDLPFYLKHCFLYCCVSGDGCPIKRKKLIRLWVAEGFIREQKGLTMEEVAEEYLTELIFRSMIQVIETNDAGRVKTCRVHDVMRELAMTACEKDNFFTAYDGHHESKLEGKIRRLSIHHRGESIQMSKGMSRNLRSLFVFDTDECSQFSLSVVLPKLKLLRVLELPGVPIVTIPKALVGLFNLRYLNLRETKIRKLPKSMEKLKNLQTLDVGKTLLERIPSGVSKLPKLRHLYMYRNNNHSSIQAPAGIWNVQGLQTLTCIEAEEHLVGKLGNLTELRRLEITKVKAVNGPKLCDSVQKMTSLLHLGIVSVSGEELELEVLSLPPLFLQKLTLVGAMSSVPHWLKSLVHLTHLRLGFTHLQEDVLSSLRLLSSLVFLELDRAFGGKLLHFQTGWFPRLNKLKLVELARLESVKVEEGALLSIKELYLIRCMELRVVPEGVEHCKGLQKLHLEEMLEDLLQSLQNDTSKVLHIQTINWVYLREQTRVVETL